MKMLISITHTQAKFFKWNNFGLRTVFGYKNLSLYEITYKKVVLFLKMRNDYVREHGLEAVHKPRFCFCCFITIDFSPLQKFYF